MRSFSYIFIFIKDASVRTNVFKWSRGKYSARNLSATRKCLVAKKGFANLFGGLFCPCFHQKTPSVARYYLTSAKERHDRFASLRCLQNVTIVTYSVLKSALAATQPNAEVHAYFAHAASCNERPVCYEGKPENEAEEPWRNKQLSVCVLQLLVFIAHKAL